MMSKLSLLEKIGPIFLCLSTTVISVFGQTGPKPDSYELKTSIPPSPNAAALGKYGDIPVSYHTGIPNISIPLYEIKDGDVTLPVSLSYHASGIRVNEVASWVGLGWALNGGGVITRSIQHGPDEGPLPGKVNTPEGLWDDAPRFYSGYYRDGYTLPPGYQNVFAFNDPVDVPTSATLAYRTTYNAMLDAAAGNSDTEPDIFFFNIGSYSGKFFFKVDVDTVAHTITRTPLFIPRSDVKVEVQFGNTTIPLYPSGTGTRQTFIGFTLTAPDGFKYYFGGQNATEYTGSQVFNLQNHNQLVSVTLAPSSWYLTRIESPTGRHIDLEYTNDTYGYYDLAPERCWNGDYLSLSDQMISRNIVNGLKLSRIYSGSEEIQFKAETVREDLSNYDNSGGGEEITNVTTKRLDRIEVKQLDGSIVKKFLFNYNYFRSPDDSKFPKFIEDIPALKASFTTDRNRLRLESVSEESGDGNTAIPPHQFTYIDKDIIGQTATLPRRLSYQQDHWGYYNHQTANTGLISFWVNPRKNRRETNHQYTQVGTLNSIKYPTGGTTTFNYESHESTWMAEDVESPDIGRIYNADSGTASGNGSSVTVSFGTVTGIPDVSSACMTLGTDCDVIYNITLKFRAGSPTGGTYNLNYDNFNITPAIEIYRVGNSTPIYRYDFGYLADCGSATNCSLYTGGQPGQSFREITRVVSFQLPPGSYYAKAYRYEGTNTDNSANLFTASVAIQIPRDRDPNYQSPATLGLRKVGGLRIKSITTSDGTGTTPDQQRVYTYPPNGGILFSLPQYYYRVQYLYTRITSAFPAINGETFTQIWSSNSVLPMRTTQGSHIGYAWVKEEQVGNGYKIYSYDVAEHSHAIINNPYFQGNTYNYQADGRQYSYPVYPAPMDLERGNLLSEEHYSSNDKLVMSTRTTYEAGDDIFLLRASKVDLLRAPVPGSVWYVGYTHYPIFTSTNRVKTTTVNTSYDATGNNPATVVTTYDYQGTGHLQATSVTRTLDDVEYVDYIIYPPDYGSISSTAGGIKNLRDKNVINVPIEKYTVKRATGETTGKVISGMLTQYMTTLTLPDAVYSLKLLQPLAEATFTKSNSTPGNFNPSSLYEKRISYYAYDGLGNIQELSKDKDTHITYIWGYSGLRPIAEVKNATRSQVFHTSFEDATSNFSNEAKTGNKSLNVDYNVILPSAGTYKLSYWKKIGGNPWTLIETTISANTNIGATGVLIDEVRLYPVGAQMTTYTYDLSAGIITTTDVNNLVTRNHYDALKRLQYVTDNNGKVLKVYTYHYKNQQGN